MIRGEFKHLGTFDTEEQAHQARVSEKQRQGVSPPADRPDRRIALTLPELMQKIAKSDM